MGGWVSRGGGTNEISRSRSVLSVSRALKQLVAASKGGGTCGGRIGGEGRQNRAGEGRKIRLETFLGFISAIRNGFLPLPSSSPRRKRKDTRDTRRNFSCFLSSPSESGERSFPRAGRRLEDRTNRSKRKIVPERRNNNEISFSLSREHGSGREPINL